MAEQDPQYDPTNFTVDEVNAYLDTADDTERARVLQAETDGKARVGILEGRHAAQEEPTDPEPTEEPATPEEPTQAPEEPAEGEPATTDATAGDGTDASDVLTDGAPVSQEPGHPDAEASTEGDGTNAEDVLNDGAPQANADPLTDADGYHGDVAGPDDQFAVRPAGESAPEGVDTDKAAGYVQPADAPKVEGTAATIQDQEAPQVDGEQYQRGYFGDLPGEREDLTLGAVLARQQAAQQTEEA